LGTGDSQGFALEIQLESKKEKGGGPGLPASLIFPLSGIPTSLTEGGQPVVLAAYETAETQKKLQPIEKK
jgi:hypothetical protein